ncbi:MAG: hypothetical protein JNK64_09150 [Myxococcales bacterium]|nr:hypothetical protein [Myxococcales bacterium]
MGEFHREVLPPRPAPGLGMTAPLIVLLATLFVTMALAAMTLVPRPPPAPRVTPVRPAAVAPTPRRAAIEVDLTRCRAPVHRANPDGTVDVTFETCR